MRNAIALLVGTLFWPAPSMKADTGTIQDVQHVVILTMENRAFDQYYGCLGGVRGYQDSNALLFQNGSNVFYQPQNASQPQNTNYVLPFHILDQCVTDVGHDWYWGHIAWNQGKWNQWIPARSARGMIFCTRDDLSFYYALADAYTICDAYFCSMIGPTIPNRLYQLTGMIDPRGTGGGPVIDFDPPAAGYTWTTYPERLQAAGVSWKVYQSSADYMEGNPLRWFTQFKNLQPGNPLYDQGLRLVPDLVAAFRADVTNGTLPRVSWIVPGWTTSEHPPYSPTLGQALSKQLLTALMANPAIYNSTVFLLTYDENGGFFDHVPSPIAPPGTPDEFVNGWPLGPGFRVPMIVVSPWSRGGYVCSQVFDHTSILRFLETWTGVQETNISAWRRQVCGDLTSAFDFAHPNTNYPSLPAAVGVWCGSGYDPAMPSPQIFPVQESGTKPARPLPYQPDAASSLDCATSRFWLTLKNSGRASVHFALYANAYRNDGPWQYDVTNGSPRVDSFNISVLGHARYDFTCYGPNGFQRRFAGNPDTNCNTVEVTSTIMPNTGGLVLNFTNGTALPASFTVTDGYQLGGPWTFSVPPGQAISNNFGIVASNNGWYDLTAVADVDAAFLRRFAGHVEMPVVPVQIACATNKSIQYGEVLVFDPPTVLSACPGTNVTIVQLTPSTNGQCPQVITQPWLVTDACGNSDTCAQIVTILSTSPPVIACPADQTIRCGRPFIFTPPTVLNSGSGTNVTIVPLTPVTNGQCPQTITQPWVVTDACGNFSTCTQVITTVDSAPAFVCTSNKTVACGIAFDFDPPVVLSACGNTNGIIIPLAMMTNNQCPLVITQPWLVIDGCGETNICSEVVTVACADCPVLVLTKQCPAFPVPPGGLLTFNGTVTNAGGLTLTNLVVVDDQPAPNTLVFGPATLAPGAGAFFSLSYRVPACSCGPFMDTLTATATGLDGTTLSNSIVTACPGTNYAIAGDLNGDGIVDQSELNAVLANYWAHSQWIYMSNAISLGHGLFQFSLTNASAWNFSILATTNFVDWTNLPGPAYPVFQFFDPAAASNAPARFYRLRYP